MSNAILLALDFGLRGGAIGLFLMTATIRLRDRGLARTTMVGSALGLAAADFALWTAPGFPQFAWWSAPVRSLSASAPVLIWLWARAVFDDDFRIRPWHGALWAVVSVVGISPMVARANWPAAADMAGQSVSVISLLFTALAAAQALATWRADLMAGRRRLRVAVLIGTCFYVAALAALDSLPHAGAGATTGLPMNVASAVALCALAALSAWGVLRSIELQPAAGNGKDQVSREPGEAQPAIDHNQLARLQKVMSVERAYRQERLTIAGLAAQLELPEYRLRQLINEGLGYRNFNAFLNRYRLDDAKAALADPGQKDVSVLTIAMDAGFQSVGPFNRAFKADTGVTPTEFRRAACQTGGSE